MFCVKYIVIVYNFLFWLVGIGILGASLFLYVDSKEYVNFESTAELYETPFFILMIVGIIMTFVGFLGCCGAIKENSCLLTTYILFCITIGCACAVAVGWVFQNDQKVRLKIKSEFRKQFREKYSSDNGMGATEYLIDKIQRDFACCGDKGIYDWNNSIFNHPDQGRNSSKKAHLESGISGNEHYKVPASCCGQIMAANECENQRKFVLRLGENAVGLNREGCSSKVEQFVEEKWYYFILFGLILVGIQLIALFLSCCLCCSIGRNRE